MPKRTPEEQAAYDKGYEDHGDEVLYSANPHPLKKESVALRDAWSDGWNDADEDQAEADEESDDEGDDSDGED